jgi:hypothetical protein
VREKSKLLIVSLGADPAAREKLREIVDAYKKRFRQQGVLTIIRPACVSF